jgi:hypothetical protein
MFVPPDISAIMTRSVRPEKHKLISVHFALISLCGAHKKAPADWPGLLGWNGAGNDSRVSRSAPAMSASSPTLS